MLARCSLGFDVCMVVMCHDLDRIGFDASDVHSVRKFQNEKTTQPYTKQTNIKWHTSINL